VSLSTPVALVFHRRPLLLERVFAAVAAVRPRRLFLIADGPRDDADEAACAAARRIADAVSWPCAVERSYADVNMGIRDRVSSGLDWVFHQVDEAIILEDDCLPAPSFFQYCEALLATYRDDERIFGIGGADFQLGRRRGNPSYHFSGYCGIWGWASWARAWRHYDVAIRGWPSLRAAGLLEGFWESRREIAYWRWVFDQVHAGRIDTWDYQLFLAMWTQRALFIHPAANLVSNIGFGPGATHTWRRHHPLAQRPLAGLPVLEHPDAVFRDAAADRFIFRRVFRGNRPIWARRLQAWSRARQTAGAPERVPRIDGEASR
jgi:hypothetical protein